MSGLSGAFILPIATLAIVSMFLSIGGLIESSFSYKLSLQRIGTFIKSIAFPILQAIPLLFCVAFTYSFCKGDLTCIWSVIIAYLTFLSVQGVFIYPSNHSALDSYSSHRTDSVVVMFPGPWRDSKLMTNLVDKTLGFTALNTSIFGSFILGGVMMPFIQRHFFNVNLKGPFSFFSGKRFVPLISVLFAAAIAIYFLILWPWVGSLFSYIGNKMSKTPGGLDSLLFGFLEKCLIPVGLHHMFYAPLWFSPLGGDAVSRINEVVTNCNGTSGTCSYLVSALSPDLVRMPSTSNQSIWNIHGGARVPHSMWQGDSFLGVSIISLPTNKINNIPAFQYFQNTLGINVGRYTNGKYPVMQFGLPFAALGMSLSTENPKQALKSFTPGILSSSLLGITEPLEFTFLFSAPKLFYGFHAVMCGISFMLMNLMGAHIPSIFSGGFVEFLLLGILPVGKGTNFHTYLYLGMILAPLYTWVFYVAANRNMVAVPGVQAESEASEMATESPVPEQTRKLALALGGWSNIEKMANCASRLRYDIVDKSKVNEDALKAAGVIAVKWVGDNHLQAIVGPKAEGINNEMLKWKGEKI